MREQRFSVVAAVACALSVLVLVLMLLLVGVLGRGGGQSRALPSAIEFSDGVPVGVEHTAAGGLAAADNYLALASQSIEQDPALFGAFVAQAYAPEARSHTLAPAQQLR